MQKVALSTLLALLVVFPSSVLADPPTVNIPPTNAYSSVTTSNGSVSAPNFIGNLHFVGQGHISVTSSNGSQTVYFNGAPITPVGDRFGWYASNTIGNGGTKDLHLYNFSTGHGISATVGPDDFILSAVNFVNASSKSCGSNAFFDSFDNLTGIFVCKAVNGTGTLDTIQNLTPAQAYVYKSNNTNTNFQFRGINVTGSLQASNSSNLITIHGNQYQNNTGLNIGKGGKGVYAGNTGSILDFKNVTSTRPDLVTISANTTDVNIGSNFKSDSVTCAGNSKISAFNNATGIYTCTGGTGAINSINKDTNSSQYIIREVGNTTVTNTTATHKIGLGPNVFIITGSPQTVSKRATFNNFTLSNSQISNPFSEVIAVNKSNTASYILYNGSTNVVMSTNTDVGALLNTGIASLSSTRGGTIKMMEGNYSLSTSAIFNKASTMVIGSGDGTSSTHGVTRIRLADNTAITNMFRAQFGGLDNLYFRDIYLEGNSQNNKAATTNCFDITSVSNFRLENVGMQHCPGYGVKLQNVNYGFWKNVYVEFGNRTGVYVTNSKGNVFTDLITFNNKDNGFYIADGAKNNMINNFNLIGDQKNGLMIEANGTDSASADFNTFNNGQINQEGFSTGKNGIVINGAQHDIFSNIAIQSEGQVANNVYSGISLTTDSGRCACYNLFSKNTINSNLATKPKYGISANDTLAGFNQFITNSVNGTATANYNLQNTSNVIIGNNDGTLKQFDVNSTRIFQNQIQVIDTVTNLTSTNGAGFGILENKINNQAKFRTITTDHTSTVTTNATSLLINDTGTSPDTSFYHRLRDQSWYSECYAGCVSTATTVTTANSTLAYPFLVGHGFTADRIQFEVATNAAGRCAVAIYQDNGTYYPGALLASGSDQSTAAGALKTDIISVSLRSQTLYWLASNCNNSSPTLRTIAGSAVAPILGWTGSAGAGQNIIGYQVAKTNPSSGFAFDNPYPSTGSNLQNSNALIIQVRAQ